MKLRTFRSLFGNSYRSTISRFYDNKRRKTLVPLRVESLEDRCLMDAGPAPILPLVGVTLQNPTTPNLNQLWSTVTDKSTPPVTKIVPTLDGNGADLGQYQAPGSNALSPSPYKNINQPFIVNSSPRFNQPVQSSDWWSNLMFRLDPSDVGGAKFAYGNEFLFTDPLQLRFTNQLYNNATGDWVEGLSFLNPDTFGIRPSPAGPSATTNRQFYTMEVTPLTLGIGNAKRIDPNNPFSGAIAPLDTDSDPINHAIDEGRLRTRVNHYSDWGVQVVYGDGNPDQGDPNKPDYPKNTLTIDMTNGSPFIDFTKKGAAPANLYLTPLGIGSDLGTNQIWGTDLTDPAYSDFKLPSNMVGITSRALWTDDAGVRHTNLSSYLIIADKGSWSLGTNYDKSTPSQLRLLTNTTIGDGKIVVVMLPHMIGNTPFEQLSPQDQVNVAKLFYKAPSVDKSAPIFNFPKNDSTATQVSDPNTHSESYGKPPATVVFGYDPATSMVRTKYTINTDNGQPAIQVLYPHQTDNLLPTDQANYLNYNGQPITYFTKNGTARLYMSPTNTFATQIPYSGILPYLPSAAAQSDAAVAATLYNDAAQWFDGYVNNPLGTFGATDNTYQLDFTQVGQQLLILDQLSAPTSLLTPAEQANAAAWRDRIMQDLKWNLFSWFDTSTGRNFQLNTTYNTLIGYPAGFGSDYGINDHHFHYGYFLSGFAAIAQFDLEFVQALLPQITLLVNDVANFDRSSNDFPFLREFNAWEGHSWANGQSPGGADQESIGESIQFSSSLVLLGMKLNIPDWQNRGIYLYSTEIDSANEYWFNTKADPVNGNYGNYPQDFISYNLNGSPTFITQITNPKQKGPDLSLFFTPPNYGEGAYAINWLPISAQTLYLGHDQAYLQRNWAQFIKDYYLQTPTPDGTYQLLVAAYQSLMPDTGFGINQPGPDNALLRLDPSINSALIPPAPDNIVNNQYLGTTRLQALNWIYNLAQLGQVDTTVVADKPSYAVFIKNGQRSFVAYNASTSNVLTVTFTDSLSNTVLATLTVQPGQMLTQLASGQRITNQLNQARAASLGTSLYLRKVDSSTNTGVLNAQPGSGVPDPNAKTDAQKLNPATYANTFATVPVNPMAAQTGDAFPGDANVLTYLSGPLNGTYLPGGKTAFQLFMDNLVTWTTPHSQFPLDPKYGPQYGPGVVQSTVFGSPNVIVEISYTFNGTNGLTYTDRVERYLMQLSSNNQYYIYDTTSSHPGITFSKDFDPSTLANQPFQNMVNGGVRIRIWGGASSSVIKEFSISSDSTPEMARTSRLIIPFDLTKNGQSDTLLTVNNISPVTPNRRAAPVDSVTIYLSAPVKSGSASANALTVTRDGVSLPLDGVLVSLVSGSTYQITGLAGLQDKSGLYVLTVDASQLRNPAGDEGSGQQSITWVIDQAALTVALASTASKQSTTTPIAVTVLFNKPVSGFDASKLRLTNGVATNFRGDGNLYTFDLTPINPASNVTVSVPAGVAVDAAGNQNIASKDLVPSLALVGPTVQVLADVLGSTKLTPIPIRVKFSSAVTISAANLLNQILVTNGDLSNPSTSDNITYTFNLTPKVEGLVIVQVPAGVAQDGSNKPNSAAAAFSVTYDKTAPTLTLISSDSPRVISDTLSTHIASGIGIFNPNSSTFFLKDGPLPPSNPDRSVNFNLGIPTTNMQPIAGSWTGNSIAGVGLYDSATSRFYLKNANTDSGSDNSFQFGAAGLGWIPIAGDWTGQGKTTIGLYDPKSSTFFLKNSNSGGSADITFNFGPAGLGWLPVAGDWDGTGNDTIGLFDPVSSTFYLKNTNAAGNADIIFQFGPANLPKESQLKPIAGRWTESAFATTLGLYNPINGIFLLRNANLPGVADFRIQLGPGKLGWLPIAGNWTGRQSDQAVTVIAQFSKPVTGFDATKISFSNATLANFAGSGSRYTFDLIPNGVGLVSAQVAANAGTDAAGNSSTESNFFSRVFQLRPEATIFTTAGPVTSSTNVPIYVQFNEPVQVNPSAIAITNANLLDTITQISPTTWLFHIQPTAVGNTNTIVTILLGQNKVTDAFGNPNLHDAKLLFVYAPVPALAVSKFELIGAAGVYSQVSVIFNQDVTGFDASKLVVDSNNAKITGFTGGGNSYNFFLTAFPDPKTDYDKTMTIKVSIPAGAVIGSNGQPLADAKQLSYVTPVITGPTAVITAPTIHDRWFVGPIPITILFSDDVTGVAPQANLIIGGAPKPPDSDVTVGKNSMKFTLNPDSFSTPSANVSVNFSTGSIVAGSRALIGGIPALNVTVVPGPVVTNVTSSATGIKLPGDLIQINVTFSSPVKVDTTAGTPILLLNAVGPAGNAVATYVNGSGTKTLTFNYVVQIGQRTGHLDYLYNGAFVQGAAKLTDPSTGKDIFLPVTMADPGSPGSLGANTNITTGFAPTGITSVSFAPSISDGTYPVGAVIPIVIRFNDIVTVDTKLGTPTLTLNVGGGNARAQYTSGTGSNTLTFNYTVATGDVNPALDYSSSFALSENGGLILAKDGTRADIILPPPGAVGSLGRSGVVAVTDHPARVLSVVANRTNIVIGTLVDPEKGITPLVRIFVSFDSPVTVTGKPTLTIALDGGKTATANYVGPTGVPLVTLEFDYTVVKGDDALRLDYASREALVVPNGSSIIDALKNNADKKLPQPGQAGSLRNNTIQVVGSPPKIVSVNTVRVNGGYNLSDVLKVTITFSRIVTVIPGKDPSNIPQLKLNAGTTAIGINPDVKKDQPIMTFVYTIAAGQNTPLLDVAGIDAFDLNGSVVKDANPAVADGPANTSLAGATLLSSTASLAVQTNTSATPTVANVTSSILNGTYGIGTKIPIIVSLSAALTVDSNTKLQIKVGSSTATADYTSGSGTKFLTFTYTVAAGQNSPLLDNGASLVPGTGSPIALPAAGTPGSLGANKRIAINTTTNTATVIGVTAAVPEGQYQPGNIIPIQVHFSRPVFVTGTGIPQLQLATGGTSVKAVDYTSGSGTDTLTFNYTIEAGQRSARLDYVSNGALLVPQGTSIVDAFDQIKATTSLPEPGQAGSLAANSFIVVGNPVLAQSPGPPTNQAPQSVNDQFTAAVNQTLTVGRTAGVLANDTDPNADPLTAKLVNDATHGTVFLNPDGSFQYTPNPDFAGTDSFTYQAVDALGLTSTATATIEVHFPQAGDQVTVASVPPGVAPVITVIDSNSGQPKFTIVPFDPRFIGGVNVATGDVNGDGIADIIAGAGPGGGPNVRIFDGTTGQQIAGPLGNFFAFDPNFVGGVVVASGDMNGDGIDEVIAGAGPGGGPQVSIYDVHNGQLLRTFFAFDANFVGGVRLATGYINNDNAADLIVGAGAGGGPNVVVFDGLTNAIITSFFAFDPRFVGGVYVSTGDANGDGLEEIMVGAGAGGGPAVGVFNGQGTMLNAFLAYDPTMVSGVLVAGVDMNGDGIAEMITGIVPTGGTRRAFNALTSANVDQFFQQSPQFNADIFTGSIR